MPNLADGFEKHLNPLDKKTVPHALCLLIVDDGPMLHCLHQADLKLENDRGREELSKMCVANC